MSECQGSLTISTSVTGSGADGVQLLSQLWNVLEISSQTLVANKIYLHSYRPRFGSRLVLDLLVLC